jgi:hypothetical protein
MLRLMSWIDAHLSEIAHGIRGVIVAPIALCLTRLDVKYMSPTRRPYVNMSFLALLPNRNWIEAVSLSFQSSPRFFVYIFGNILQSSSMLTSG